MSKATALAVQETALSVEEKRQQAQLEAIKQIISQRTPEKEIRTRKGRGGVTFKYTDGAYVIRTLNEALGHNWDFEADNEEVINWQNVPFEVRCRGRLTVRLNGQAVTKVQYGSQLIEFVKDRDGKVIAPVSIGDCFKGAATDAMKKCASLLGVALDLYDSDYKAENYADDETKSDTSPVQVDAAIGWPHDAIGALLRAAGHEDASGSRRYVCQQLNIGRFAETAKYLNRTEEYIRATFGELHKPASKPAPSNGPSRKAVFDRKHSPKIGSRLDAACKRLAIHGLTGEQLLSSTNETLTNNGRQHVQTRYELDEEEAVLISETFEKWADVLDRKAVKQS
jgi:hypothetical protein